MKTIDLDDFGGDATGRLILRQRNTCGCGLTKFIPHKNLPPNYLKNDCLRVSIKEVKVSNTL